MKTLGTPIFIMVIPGAFIPEIWTLLKGLAIMWLGGMFLMMFFPKGLGG